MKKLCALLCISCSILSMTMPVFANDPVADQESIYAYDQGASYKSVDESLKSVSAAEEEVYYSFAGVLSFRGITPPEKTHIYRTVDGVKVGGYVYLQHVFAVTAESCSGYYIGQLSNVGLIDFIK
jgi:hypothetical protein